MTLPIDTSLDLQTVNKIVNSPNPSAGGDVANKTYVDSLAQGVMFLEAVRVASTADVTVASPGASIDAVALSAGDRVLLKNQGTGSQNGPWVWNGAAVAMTRPADYLNATTFRPGMSVYVEEGSTANLGAIFTITGTHAEGTIGTDATTWTQTNGAADITVSAPLTKTGNNIAIEDPLTIGHGGTNASTAAGARSSLGVPGKYATTIGDGAATTITVTHNLGSRDVIVQVWDMATGNLELAGVAVTGVNSVDVSFGAAPAAAGGTLGSGTGKRVVVLG